MCMLYFYTEKSHISKHNLFGIHDTKPGSRVRVRVCVFVWVSISNGSALHVIPLTRAALKHA